MREQCEDPAFAKLNSMTSPDHRVHCLLPVVPAAHNDSVDQEIRQTPPSGLSPAGSGHCRQALSRLAETPLSSQRLVQSRQRLHNLMSPERLPSSIDHSEQHGTVRRDRIYYPARSQHPATQPRQNDTCVVPPGPEREIHRHKCHKVPATLGRRRPDKTQASILALGICSSGGRGAAPSPSARPVGQPLRRPLRCPVTQPVSNVFQGTPLPESGQSSSIGRQRPFQHIVPTGP